MSDEDHPIRAAMRAPRGAAIAGILFSILLFVSLVLIRLSVPDPKDAGLERAPNLEAINLALNLVPFAGITFLWFIGVLRDRLGAKEDRFFSTVFFGSGLLFLAMLFASSAVAGAVVMARESADNLNAGLDALAFGRNVAYQTMNVYAVKMAGVFMISTSTLAIRTGIFPRWMSFLGYALALLLLLSIGHLVWVALVFPSWVMLISVYILWANLKVEPARAV
jgi:hypothetical protein